LDEDDIKSSFIMNKGKLYLINNFDLEEFYHIKMYNVELPNLFIFQINNLNCDGSLKRVDSHLSTTLVNIECEYLIELVSIGKFMVLTTFEKNTLVFILYDCETQLIKHRYSCSILVELSDPYKLCSARERENKIIFFVANSSLLELIIENDKLNMEAQILDGIKGKINCVYSDKLKFILSCEDNSIKVFAPKSKKLRYNLLGGSTTVVPKSFVANPKKSGFSIIKVSESKILGAIGNLIREFNFTYN